MANQYGSFIFFRTFWFVALLGLYDLKIFYKNAENENRTLFELYSRFENGSNNTDRDCCVQAFKGFAVLAHEVGLLNINLAIGSLKGRACLFVVEDVCIHIFHISDFSDQCFALGVD